MDITEMQKLFRQLAQQMGMQNVFAIRPEEIDMLLNTSISETVNNITIQYLGKNRDNNIEDNKLGLINALRTLHKTESVNLPIMINTDGTSPKGITDNTLDFVWDGSYEDAIFSQNKGSILSSSPRLYTNFSINYVRCKTGNHGWEYDNDSNSPLNINNYYVPIIDKSNPKITKYFSIRSVDNNYIPNIVDDYILKPKYNSPLAVIEDNKIIIHFGKLNNNGFFDKDLAPYEMKVSYIKEPTKVDSISNPKVSCDLPNYLHETIVEQAVKLWKQSVYNATQPVQQ